jgi:hypothetical protein
VRARLLAADQLCPACQHFGRYHHDGICFYPVAPRAEDCGCTERTNELEGEK